MHDDRPCDEFGALPEGKTLLVIGFGPFDHYSRNPSGEIAVAVDGRLFAGVRIRGMRVPVTWRGSWELVRDEVESLGPIGLLCLGIAPDPFIRLESRAMNLVGPRRDVAGELFSDMRPSPIIPEAPLAYTSSLPLRWLSRRFDLRPGADVGPVPPGLAIEARLWHDAGQFLCNYLFFNVMHHLGRSIRACGFVHLPRLPGAGEKERPSEEAIVTSGEWLIESLARWLIEPSLAREEA